MANYLIAAGGTGGHIYPGLAIAQHIKLSDENSHVTFCGTKTGMENKLVIEANFELLHIDALGFSFKSPIKFIKASIAFIKGVKQSKKIILDRKIDIVIGTGGYVCAPVVYAASKLGIKTLLHEQNAFPGKANRKLSRRADCVCASFESSLKYFHNGNIIVTGNPVRSEFFQTTMSEARKKLNFDSAQKIVYATGGSQGSRSINEAVLGLAKKYFSLGYRIILSSGSRDFETLRQKNNMPDGIFKIHEYINEQHLYMAAADIVICRAGAITCAEIAALGKPSIMVPFPYAAGDHQTLNARAFKDIGAGILIADNKLTPAVLYEELGALFSNENKLLDMGQAAFSLAYPEAIKKIYEQILILKNG